jgi:hypothetical protein
MNVFQRMPGYFRYLGKNETPGRGSQAPSRRNKWHENTLARYQSSCFVASCLELKVTADGAFQFRHVFRETTDPALGRSNGCDCKGNKGRHRMQNDQRDFRFRQPKSFLLGPLTSRTVKTRACFFSCL